MDTWLNRFVNVALVAAVVLIGYRQVVPAKAPVPTMPPEHAIGETLTTDLLEIAPGQPAVIVVTASSCKYCTESMPFYQTLAAAARVAGVAFVPIANGDTPDVNAAYLRTNRVEIDRQPLESRGVGLKVAGTPTLLVVDGKAKIVAAHKGLLGVAAQQAVLRRVRELGQGGRG